jgi:CheY-like chemotaxis protein
MLLDQCETTCEASAQDNPFPPSLMQHHMNSRQRILVVDDEPDICRLHSEILRHSGYEVDAVENGFAAWTALQLHTYDLIVTDNNMPGITGIDLIKRLQESNITTPVIIATGSIPDAKHSEVLGETPVLLKPYPFEQLLKTVKDVLYTQNIGRADATPPPNWRGELLCV